VIDPTGKVRAAFGDPAVEDHAHVDREESPRESL